MEENPLFADSIEPHSPRYNALAMHKIVQAEWQRFKQSPRKVEGIINRPGSEVARMACDYHFATRSQWDQRLKSAPRHEREAEPQLIVLDDALHWWRHDEAKRSWIVLSPLGNCWIKDLDNGKCFVTAQSSEDLERLQNGCNAQIYESWQCTQCRRANKPHVLKCEECCKARWGRCPETTCAEPQMAKWTTCHKCGVHNGIYII